MRHFLNVVAVAALFIGCSESSNREATDEDGAAAKQALGPLQGSIAKRPWHYARGLAYVSPKIPNTIVINFFDEGGPTGCQTEGDSILHSYASEDASRGEGRDVMVFLSTELGRLPWIGEDVEVAVSNDSPSGGSMSVPARGAIVEVSEMTKTRIVGTLSADSENGNVKGSFTATFCEGAGPE